MNKGLLKGRDVEAASYADSWGRVVRYRARVLPDVIAPTPDPFSKKGQCVVFVTHGPDGPRPAQPYELVRMCKGGCLYEGRRTFATKAEALQAARSAARLEKPWQSMVGPYRPRKKQTR
mgnify:FL=1